MPYQGYFTESTIKDISIAKIILFSILYGLAMLERYFECPSMQFTPDMAPPRIDCSGAFKPSMGTPYAFPTHKGPRNQSPPALNVRIRKFVKTK